MSTDNLPAVADEDADLGALIDELQRAAGAETVDGELVEARPLAAGTFAFYPDGRGGLVMVMDIRDGAFPEGVHRGRIPPAMLRAVGVLAGGGSPLQAVKALARGGRGRR